MRITHTTDEHGVVRLLLEFAGDADPDQMADVAWSGVNRVLAAAARRRGTTPPGLAGTVAALARADAVAAETTAPR